MDTYTNRRGQTFGIKKGFYNDEVVPMDTHTAFSAPQYQGFDANTRALFMRANAGDRLSKKEYKRMAGASFLANGGNIDENLAARARNIDPLQHMKERAQEGMIKAQADALYGDGASRSPAWLKANRDTFLAQRDSAANNAQKSRLEAARTYNALERDRLARDFDEIRNEQARMGLGEFKAAAGARQDEIAAASLNAAHALALAQNNFNNIGSAIKAADLAEQNKIQKLENENVALRSSGEALKRNDSARGVYENDFNQNVLPNLDSTDPSHNLIRLLAESGNYQAAAEGYYNLQAQRNLQEQTLRRQEEADKQRKIAAVLRNAQNYEKDLRKNAPYGTSDEDIKKAVDWFEASQKVAFGIATADEWATFNRLWDMQPDQAKEFIRSAVNDGAIRADDVKGLVAKYQAEQEKKNAKK